MNTGMLASVNLPDRQIWTLDDLLDIPDDGHRYEIFDGSLLMSAAPTPLHQVVAYRLTRLLEEAAPPEVGAVGAVAIDMGSDVPVPDVVVAFGSAVWNSDAKALLPADVLLVVEVVSPTSTRRDRIAKRDLYAAAGIPLYWLVELQGGGAPYVVCHRRTASGYRKVATVVAGEELEVSTPFPLRLRPADLVGPPRKG